MNEEILLDGQDSLSLQAIWPSDCLRCRAPLPSSKVSRKILHAICLRILCRDDDADEGDDGDSNHNGGDDDYDTEDDDGDKDSDDDDDDNDDGGSGVSGKGYLHMFISIPLHPILPRLRTPDDDDDDGDDDDDYYL
eukprot:12425561-Karenia_brevis.AAC.1